jgi:hypothetical protein
MKLALVAVAVVLGIAGAQAQERGYHAKTHKLVSQMNFGNHREYGALMEQLLNQVPSSAHGYVSHMIDHAPRGPGDPFYFYNTSP